MEVNHTIPKRRLKPFKRFLAELYRNPGQRRVIGVAAIAGEAACLRSVQ